MGFPYHVYGSSSNTPLILLHPGGVLHHIWQPFIREWSDRYDVIAFDLLPDVMQTYPALDAVASDILITLEALQIDRFHLIGASIGANIALHIALQAPDSVHSLIVDSAQVGSPDVPVAISLILNSLKGLIRLIPTTLIERFLLNQFKHLSPQDHEQVRTELRQIGKHAFVQHALASTRHDVSTSLHNITAPTLIIAGSNDMLTRNGEPDKLQAGIPNARLMLVDGASHVTFLTHAPFFLNAVQHFLDTI